MGLFWNCCHSLDQIQDQQILTPKATTLAFKLWGFSIAWIISIFALSSCTNNMSINGNLTTSTIVTSPPVSGTSNGGAFTLSRVVANTSSTTPALLDLIGDGTGTFANVCPTQGTAGSPVCNCTFYYNTPTHPNQQVDTPIVYEETNLLRCSYAGIPSDVTSFDVAVHVTSADTYSNKVTFKLSTTGATVDTTDPNNFVMPVRYQCRDIVNVNYLLDGSVYDPFQSEDPHLTYPLDFYTPDLGLAVQTYINSFGQVPNLQYWNCPPILNPTTYLVGDPNDPSSPIAKYNSTNHMNLTVYSKAPLGGSSIIYPPSGPFDRSTFYLSKTQTAVFSVPVNGLISPGVNTSTALAPKPLGYGANPIPIGTGTGTESCPDSTVPIPPGFHWVKVWLFRASLPQRYYKTSSTLTQQVKSIACNPGDWILTTQSNAKGPVFTGCYKTHDNSVAGDISSYYYSLSLGDVGKTVNGRSVYLSDRYLGSMNCVRLQDPSQSSTCSITGGGYRAGPGCNLYDSWLGENPFVNATTPGNSGPFAAAGSVGCGTSPASDPFGICGTTTIGNAGKTPVITDVTSVGYDTGGSRFDFLFVVSPPGITVANMQDTTGSSISLPYQPMRFKLAEDCTSSDPGSPTCSSSQLITYDVKLHDIGTNGDPPADNPQLGTRAGVFPVCALQPN